MDNFQQRLGYTFRNISLLREALTHPSHVRNQSKNLPHNQRLEFLGDAVLQLAVTAKLFELFPDAQEGDLTKFRARVVSREHLAHLARSLSVGEALFLGSGEERNAGRDRESNLADAIEAVIGAVFIDGGWEAAKFTVLDMMSLSLQDLQSVDSTNGSNAKGTLQELLQKNGGETPVYHCISSKGEAHDRSYTVSLMWKGRELSQGTGKSKRAAETEAAKLALAQQTPKAETD